MNCSKISSFVFQKPNQHEEDHYETIPKSNLDDPRRKYKTNTAVVRPSQNRDNNSPDLEFASNLRKAASMPDIHDNSNLRGILREDLNRLKKSPVKKSAG